MSEFTHILARVEQGDPKAAGELLPIVYEELRRLASQKMANEAAGHTLQPTALVHEAWMRLGGSDAPTFQNRAHFFGAAAEAMRRILIEHARRRLAAKRGAGVEVVDLDRIEISSPAADDDHLIAMNEALEKYADDVRGWNSDGVVEAILGETNEWHMPTGELRDPRPIKRYGC